MSRIHEALKRAEREKGRGAPAAPPQPEAAQPFAVAPAAAASPAVVSSLAASAPAPAVAVAAPAAQPVAPASPAGAAKPPLLQSCRMAHWHEDRSKLFFLGSKGLSLGAEQLRNLRSRLYQMRETRPLKTVLLTSAMSGEGKTFVCANLAYAFARQTDRRVLLLDADLRAPALHSVLGAPSEPGLAEHLQGRASLEKILQRGPQENFYFIPAGKPPANPAELVAGGKLKGLLAQLAPLFDWILLDSPPAAPVSDALQMARWCDGVLLVVQGGKTPYDLAQGVTRELREKGLLGVVLNRTEPAAVS